MVIMKLLPDSKIAYLTKKLKACVGIVSKLLISPPCHGRYWAVQPIDNRRWGDNFQKKFLLGKLYPGCQRLFKRGFRFRSSLKKWLRRSCLLPKAEDVSACGRRSSSSHARKNLWYPGQGNLSLKKILREVIRKKKLLQRKRHAQHLRLLKEWDKGKRKHKTMSKDKEN